MSKTDEYKITKLYKSNADLIDLRAFVETVKRKVYINETNTVGGTKVEIVGVSKAFVDYILWEMENLNTKKRSLKEISKESECHEDDSLNELKMGFGNWPI